MEVRELTQDNIKDYEGIVRPDAAEDIGRANYKGFALHEENGGEPDAAMIWKLKGIDSSQKQAEIKWFFAENEEYCRLLFKEFEAKAAKEGVGEVYLEMPLGDEMSEETLERLNYHMALDESRILRVSMEQCRALIRDKQPENSRIKPLSELSLKQFNKAIAVVKSKGDQGSFGAEDFDTLPMYWYDPDISCALFNEDGRPKGLLLIHETALRMLKVELFFAEGREARAHLVDMMDFTVRAALEKFYPEKEIDIDREGESARAITERLFPGVHGSEVVTALKDFK